MDTLERKIINNNSNKTSRFRAMQRDLLQTTCVFRRQTVKIISSDNIIMFTKWIMILIIPTPTMAINVTLLQVDRVFNLYKSGDGATLLDAFVSKAEPLYRYSIISIAKLCVIIKAFVSRSLSRWP